MIKYGIPMPPKPPEASASTVKLEVLSDKHIFTQVLMGIQSFLPVHTRAFIQSTNPTIREQFKNFLIQELDMYDKLFEYGKMKSWINPTPKYKTS